MASIGAHNAESGPEYMINSPSGDQAGLKAGLDTMRTGSPLSTGILKSPGPLMSLPPVTIQLPSGDQEAAPRTSIDSPIGFSSAPSPDIMWSRRLPSRFSTRVARRPSGDTAGGSRSASSAPFHISRACPSPYRHSPSPVPLD